MNALAPRPAVSSEIPTGDLRRLRIATISSEWPLDFVRDIHDHFGRDIDLGIVQIDHRQFMRRNIVEYARARNSQPYSGFYPDIDVGMSFNVIGEDGSLRRVSPPTAERLGDEACSFLEHCDIVVINAGFISGATNFLALAGWARGFNLRSEIVLQADMASTHSVSSPFVRDRDFALSDKSSISHVADMIHAAAVAPTIHRLLQTYAPNADISGICVGDFSRITFGVLYRVCLAKTIDDYPLLRETFKCLLERTNAQTHDFVPEVRSLFERLPHSFSDETKLDRWRSVERAEDGSLESKVAAIEAHCGMLARVLGGLL
jgi:hypothetical protein